MLASPAAWFVVLFAVVLVVPVFVAVVVLASRGTGRTAADDVEASGRRGDDHESGRD